ncbi:MAG: hypothetical protein FWG99_00815 [Treponema sp.]|nr:hypothetical protein [Treponema sp.]
MKKVLITLLILCILGGVVFFFGWAQLKVPPGAYGVVTSKTHGVDMRPVRTGEFRWIWYKLIPTNVVISVFRLDPVSYSIDVKNVLPSGDSYAAFAGIDADFSWELKASQSFSIDPEKLVQLIAEHNISSQEDLAAYERDLSAKIEGAILRIFLDVDNRLLEEILAGTSNSDIEIEIEKAFPQIKNFSFTVRSVRFPDFALYSQVRLLYVEFVEKQREYISIALGEKAEKHIDTQLHFSELERYGQLLEKYPVLLEYLALEKR